MNLEELTLNELFEMRIKGLITIKKIAKAKRLSYDKLTKYYTVWIEGRIFKYKNTFTEDDYLMPEMTYKNPRINRKYRERLIEMFNR